MSPDGAAATTVNAGELQVPARWQTSAVAAPVLNYCRQTNSLVVTVNLKQFDKEGLKSINCI